MRYKAGMLSLTTRQARDIGVLRRIVLGLLLLLTCQPVARAQVDDSNPGRYWTLEKERMDRMRAQERRRIEQRPTHLIRRAAPVKGFTRPVPEKEAVKPADDSGAATPADAPGQDTAQQPAAPIPAEAKATVAVLGDNLGQLLGVGLTEAYAERPAVTVLRRAKENSGLVRSDYYDWMQAARDLLAGSEHIDVAVIMVGSNDRQQLRSADGASVEPRSPQWTELYTARVKALADLFKEKKVPLLWVGLPIMKNERLSADMLDFNEIYKTVAAETGIVYIDIWEAFADDRGQFSSYGPDVNGQNVRLRAGDGVHFTRAGARKLAHFVEGEIRRVLEDTKPAAAPEGAAIAAIPVVPPPGETPLVTPPGVGAATGEAAAPAAKPAPAPVLKPAAGPIVPLTAAPLSPGGKLATVADNPVKASPAGDSKAAAIVRSGLLQGEPQPSRPGRADDFAWPRK